MYSETDDWGNPVDEECGMQMGGMAMGGMMAWMIVWGLLGIALLVLAIVATVRLVRRPTTSQRDTAVESPDDVLRRRYAAGEIDEDEYLQRRAGLQG